MIPCLLYYVLPTGDNCEYYGITTTFIVIITRSYYYQAE